MRPTTTCARLETTTTVPREAGEGDAALHRAVAEDVLEVQREQEELGERDRADDRHRDVRDGERARPEEAQRQERPRRARLDDEERADQRHGGRERGERRRPTLQPSLVARVSA